MSMTLLADAAVKGVIYLALLFAVVGALRRGSAATRHLFWSIGLTGLLLIPVLSVVIPLRIELPFASGPPDVAPSFEEAAPQPVIDTSERAKDIVGTSIASGEKAAGDERAASPVVPVKSRSRVRFELPGLTGLLAALWLAGVLVVLGRLVVGLIATSVIARRGLPLDGRAWTLMLNRVRARLGVQAPVRLVSSRHAKVPFSCGVVNPVVVFPEEAEDWNDERRRAVLLHELAHFSRGDMIAHLLSQLACALHWFNPLVWLGARRLRAESERACDDLVLRAGTAPSEYAGHLIDIIRTASRSWTPVVALPMARRSEFEGRLLAILEPGVKRHGLTPAAVMFVVLAVALTAVPLAAMGPERTARAAADPSEARATGERVTALIGALDDGDIEVRRIVVASLGSLQDTTAVVALMRALRTDSDPEVREAAAYALGEIEDARAVPALGEALRQDEVTAVRLMAAHALGAIEDPRGVEPLAAAINDPDREVRVAVIHALGDIESPDAIDALSSALRDNDAEIREYAAWALGNIEDSRAVPALADVVTSDSEASVRLKAAWALGSIEHANGVDALARALDDQDPEVRQMAVWALGAIEDPRGVEPLIRVLGDSDVETRLMAINALGQIESRQAADPLIEALRDTDSRVRKAAVWALGAIEDPRAAPGLAAALSDSEVEVRRYAAAALGDLDLSSAPAELINALRDEDLEVRRYAVHALGEIEDPAAVPGLAELFRSSEADADTRRAVVWALSDIEDPAAYQVLVEALEDEDPEIRRAAARALGGNEE
ncbi:MAG: HEAT repeat domain-containing protein [Gemmatimonadales bacterium]|jgi:HEAT repeat protein/beta-lactamase regulating signal transducer with metallopeptidase domain